MLESRPNWTLPLGRSKTEGLPKRAPDVPQATPAAEHGRPLGEGAPRGPASTRPTKQYQQLQVTQESLLLTGVRLPEHHRDHRVVVLVRPSSIHRRRRAPDDGTHRTELAVREEAADRRLAAERRADRPRI